MSKFKLVKLVALKCYLHDTAILRESILCVSQFVDKIILDHGCWNGFTNSTPPAPVYKNEIDHRNHSLGLVAEADYIFWLDDDDFTFGNWPLLKRMLAKHKPQVLWVPEFMASGNQTIRPRIFRKQAGLHFKGNHTTAYVGERKVFGRHPESNSVYQASPVSIFHLDTSKKPHNYDTDMINYLKNRDEKF